MASLAQSHLAQQMLTSRRVNAVNSAGSARAGNTRVAARTVVTPRAAASHDDAPGVFSFERVLVSGVVAASIALSVAAMDAPSAYAAAAAAAAPTTHERSALELYEALSSSSSSSSSAAGATKSKPAQRSFDSIDDFYKEMQEDMVTAPKAVKVGQFGRGGRGLGLSTGLR
jgi:hypothetical protein